MLCELKYIKEAKSIKYMINFLFQYKYNNILINIRNISFIQPKIRSKCFSSSSGN